MINFKDILPGLIIVLLLTMVSYMLSLIHPSFDALAISIIFGMLIANFIKDKDIFDNGIAFSLKVFLPAGIALYGTQLSFVGMEPKLWFYVVMVFTGLFALTFFISRSFGLTKNITVLLSAGLAVCGASAIAVVSPLINAKKEEISISIISVMVLGLAGIIFYPLLTEVLVLDKSEYAFLIGTTLPMLGQVKTVGAASGPDVLSIALKLKLIRISCLIFTPLALLILGVKERRFYMPWFIVAFIALAVGVNLIKEAKIISKMIEPVSKFSLTAALAAIGLSIDFDSIAEEGIKPLISIFLSWAIIILIIYLIFSIGNV